MLGSSTLDALQRIADRANDVLAAYRPGAFPRNTDVAATRAPLPANDPLSIAAPPNTWFVTTADDGARTYTRDGVLHLDADGSLRTGAGGTVLGEANGVLRPLQIGEPDRSLGRAADPRITPDGTFSYARSTIDPRTGVRVAERVVVGRLALARFPAGTAPARLDATRFTAIPGVTPHVGTPADGAFPPLAVGARDLGNVDLDASLQRLSDAYVAFSALQAAHKAQGAGDKLTMDLVK